MRILTDRISMDEPCHGILENNRLGQNSQGVQSYHRVQSVFVIRGDSIAAYDTDLGPSINFPGVAELRLLGMGDDTVGEMLDEADRSRHDDFERKLRAEVKESSTLIGDFLQEKAENWERINNRSHFGPKYTRQRNGYDKRAAFERN